MKAIDRFKQYRDEDLDRIIIYIRNGKIKTGKYAHLVKVDPDKKIKEGHLFKDKGDGEDET